MAKKKPKKIKKATPEIEPVAETTTQQPVDEYDFGDAIGDDGHKVAEPHTEEKTEDPESPKIIEIQDDLTHTAIQTANNDDHAKHP